MMTIRLNQPEELRLARACEILKISKSELIRRGINKIIDEELSKPTPWEAGKDLFGKYDSGNKDLATNRKQIIREKLSRKFA